MIGTGSCVLMNSLKDLYGKMFVWCARDYGYFGGFGDKNVVFFFDLKPAHGK